MENSNLDTILFLEMDVEAFEDAEVADYSYLDTVFGDDLENPVYTDGTDIDFDDIELSNDDEEEY